MEDQQALPPVVVDIIAKVSGLSAVIGDVTSITAIPPDGMGRQGRLLVLARCWPATSLNEKRRNTFAS